MHMRFDIETLQLAPGDLVVVTVPEETDDQAMHALREALATALQVYEAEALVVVEGIKLQRYSQEQLEGLRDEISRLLAKRRNQPS